MKAQAADVTGSADATLVSPSAAISTSTSSIDASSAAVATAVESELEPEDDSEDSSENLTMIQPHNAAVVTAVALYAEQQGVRIIRTRRVYDLALAFDTWHALHRSARPFKLSRAIGTTLKHLARLKRNRAQKLALKRQRKKNKR